MMATRDEVANYRRKKATNSVTVEVSLQDINVESPEGNQTSKKAKIPNQKFLPVENFTPMSKSANVNEQIFLAENLFSRLAAWNGVTSFGPRENYIGP